MSKMLTSPRSDAGAPLLVHTSGLQTLQGQKKAIFFSEEWNSLKPLTVVFLFPSKAMKGYLELPLLT